MTIHSRFYRKNGNKKVREWGSAGINNGEVGKPVTRSKHQRRFYMVGYDGWLWMPHWPAEPKDEPRPMRM